jgi:predicted nucleic acid-binding protein
MKFFYDTSVLVAAFWGDHLQHEKSLRVFAEATPKDSACAAHSLAELYSVMTRLPVRPIVSPDQALLFVEDVRKHLSIISLTEDDYISTLKEASEHGVAGGRIYDALILRCAIKAHTKTIYTWNTTHFRQLAPSMEERIQTP